MSDLLKIKEYDDKFSIKIKGLVKSGKENEIEKIFIKKESINGDYYTVINTLLHYASILYQTFDENPRRLDFNDWANKAYIEATTRSENIKNEI